MSVETMKRRARLGPWWCEFFGDERDDPAAEDLDRLALLHGLRLNRCLHPDWNGREVESVLMWGDVAPAVEMLRTVDGRNKYLEDPTAAVAEAHERGLNSVAEDWAPDALRWAGDLAELFIDGWGDVDPSLAPEAVWAARHAEIGHVARYLPDHFDPLQVLHREALADLTGPWLEAVRTVRDLIAMAGHDLPELRDCRSARVRVVFRAKTAKSQGKIVFAQIRKYAAKLQGLWAPTSAQRLHGLAEAPDYEIEISAPWWLSCRTHLDTHRHEWGVRLLYHELLHVEKVDGRLKLRGHTVETFGAEQARYGARTVGEALLVTQAAAHPHTRALAKLAGDSHSFMTDGEAVHVAAVSRAEAKEGAALPPELVELLGLCREALDQDELADEGHEYVDDVQRQALELRERFLDGHLLTEDQERAIRNWRGGVNAWLRGA